MEKTEDNKRLKGNHTALQSYVMSLSSIHAMTVALNEFIIYFQEVLIRLQPLSPSKSTVEGGVDEVSPLLQSVYLWWNGLEDLVEKENKGTRDGDYLQDRYLCPFLSSVGPAGIWLIFRDLTTDNKVNWSYEDVARKAPLLLRDPVKSALRTYIDAIPVESPYTTNALLKSYLTHARAWLEHRPLFLTESTGGGASPPAVAGAGASDTTGLNVTLDRILTVPGDTSIHQMAFSHLHTRPRMVVVGNDYGSVFAWDNVLSADATAGYAITPLTIDTRVRSPTSVAFISTSHQYVRIASVSFTRPLTVWDGSKDYTESLIDTSNADPEYDNAYLVAAVPPKSGRSTPSILCVTTHNADIRVWNVGTPSPVVLSGHGEAVSSVACASSADKIWLVSGALDSSVRLWDLESLECVKLLVGHTGEVTCVAITADAQLIASAAKDHTIRLWERSTGHCIRTLLCPSHEPDFTATTIAFSPDGRWLVSGSDDGCARLWDVTTGSFICTIVNAGYRVSIKAVVFSIDGGLVAIGDTQGKVPVVRRCIHRRSRRTSCSRLYV